MAGQIHLVSELSCNTEDLSFIVSVPSLLGVVNLVALETERSHASVFTSGIFDIQINIFTPRTFQVRMDESRGEYYIK